MTVSKFHFGYTGYTMSVTQLDCSVEFRLERRGEHVATHNMVIDYGVAAQVNTIKLVVRDLLQGMVPSGRLPLELRELAASAGLTLGNENEVWREVMLGITDHDMKMAWPREIGINGLPTEHLETDVDLNASIPSLLRIGAIPLRVSPWTLTMPDGIRVWLGRQNNGTEQYLITVKKADCT